MKRTILPLALLSMLVFAAGAFAHEGAHGEVKPVSPLDRLKKLAGVWEGTAQHGDQKFPTTVTWRVTGGGSAVTELQFEGTEHEMLTVYTVQDGRIVLTHYCAGGNQPFMRERPGKNAGEIVFDYAGGANLDPKKDSHMHSALFTLVDDDHLRCEWHAYEKGQQSGKAVFELARRK